MLSRANLPRWGPLCLRVIWQQLTVVTGVFALDACGLCAAQHSHLVTGGLAKGSGRWAPPCQLVLEGAAVGFESVDVGGEAGRWRKSASVGGIPSHRRNGMPRLARDRTVIARHRCAELLHWRFTRHLQISSHGEAGADTRSCCVENVCVPHHLFALHKRLLIDIGEAGNAHLRLAFARLCVTGPTEQVTPDLLSKFGPNCCDDRVGLPHLHLRSPRAGTRMPTALIARSRHAQSAEGFRLGASPPLYGLHPSWQCLCSRRGHLLMLSFLFLGNWCRAIVSAPHCNCRDDVPKDCCRLAGRLGDLQSRIARPLDSSAINVPWSQISSRAQCCYTSEVYIQQPRHLCTSKPPNSRHMTVQG